MPIHTYESLTRKISERVQSSKQASTKAAAGDPVSENSSTVKDPAEKGGIAVPKDPNATSSAMSLPANGTNAEVTPVLNASPEKTVGSETKVASPLQQKAAAIAAGIANLRKSAGTKAASPAAAITPNMPKSDNKNEDVAPAPSTSMAPPKKQNPDPATKDASPTPATPDPTAKKVEMPAQDSKGEIPKDKTNENETGGANKSAEAGDPASKLAAELPLSFDPTFHIKLASLILSVEGGQEFARQLIEADHGHQEADALVKAASYMESEAQRLQQLEAEGAFAAEQAWNAATPEERVSILKQAHATSLATAGMNDFEKMAFDSGAGAAAGMMDAGGGAGGADPTAGAGAPPTDPSQGGGSDEISDEDILAVLEELVQAGKIKPEEAQEILAALQGGDQGGGAGGAAPGGQDPMGGAGGGMPPGMAEPDPNAPPEEKAAFVAVKSASVLADQLMPKPAAPAAK